MYFCDPPPQGRGRGGFCQLGNASSRAELRVEVGRQDLYSARQPDSNYWNGVRLPVGYARLPLAGQLQSGVLRLRLHSAEVVGHLQTNKGRVDVRILTHATEKAHIIEVNGTRGEANISRAIEFVPLTRCVDRWDVKGLINCTLNPYPAAICEAFEGGSAVCRQTLSQAEGSFATAVVQAVSLHQPGHRRVFLTTESNLWPYNTSVDPRPTALNTVRRLASMDAGATLKGHYDWWASYWSAALFSFANDADGMRTESFYNIEMYRLASSMRENGPVRDEIGPW